MSLLRLSLVFAVSLAASCGFDDFFPHLTDGDARDGLQPEDPPPAVLPPVGGEVSHRIPATPCASEEACNLIAEALDGRTWVVNHRYVGDFCSSCAEVWAYEWDTAPNGSLRTHMKMYLDDAGDTGYADGAEYCRITMRADHGEIEGFAADERMGMLWTITADTCTGGAVWGGQLNCVVQTFSAVDQATQLPAQEAPDLVLWDLTQAPDDVDAAQMADLLSAGLAEPLMFCDAADHAPGRSYCRPNQDVQW